MALIYKNVLTNNLFLYFLKTFNIFKNLNEVYNKFIINLKNK